MAAVDPRRAAAPTEAGPPGAARLHWWAGHEDALPSGLDWLSARERARVEGMRFTKRRTEYLLRRWVGKRAVAARAGLPSGTGSLARIEVLNRVTGAPYVAIDGAPSPWEISLSDRAGSAVAVIGARDGDRSALGVDIEVVEPRSRGFVSDFLTPAEQAWVAGAAAGDARLGPDAAANLVWSAKEAALKVLGLGLRADTRWVDVALVDHEVRGDGWAQLRVTWRGGRVIPGWWRREGDYLLTVAAEDDLDPPVGLPGASDLGRSRPVHSWVGEPLVTPPE
jgi:4'-phosphopantetheinyl transferase